MATRRSGRGQADFSDRTRTDLCLRVGCKCSNPDCGKATAGPLYGSFAAFLNGQAAHISAAAPGGPRFDAAITDEARRSADNGIWLCNNCAKLIDRDGPEILYPAQTLRDWKKLAEDAAAKARDVTRAATDDNSAMADVSDVYSDSSALPPPPLDGSMLTSLALHEIRLCGAKFSNKEGVDMCVADLVPLRAFTWVSSDYPVIIYTEMLEILDAHVIRYIRSSHPPPVMVIEEVALIIGAILPGTGVYPVGEGLLQSMAPLAKPVSDIGCAIIYEGLKCMRLEYATVGIDLAVHALRLATINKLPTLDAILTSFNDLKRLCDDIKHPPSGCDGTKERQLAASFAHNALEHFTLYAAAESRDRALDLQHKAYQFWQMARDANGHTPAAPYENV